MHRAVLQALRRAPGRTLLIDQQRCLDNAALADAIDARARLLRARTGGTENLTVAVRLDPGVELVISYFACLSAGLRYLALPAHPQAVLTELVEALRPALVVTSEALDPGLGPTLRVEEAPEAPHCLLPPDDPRRIAHVLLTSGSESGRPKAVLTDHVGSMLSHAWRARLWPYQPGDVVGCNVFGIWDVVPALLHGVPVVMLRDQALRDPEELAAAIVRHGINRLMLTPTLLDACLADAGARDALTRLRRIVLCGEPVTRSLAERARILLPEAGLADLYSISECHDVAAGELAPEGAPGRARIADFADVHVCDPDEPDRLVPVGEPGRVLVGGHALARDYLDAATTAQRFRTVTFRGLLPPQRVYDTGDLGRLHRDGTLEVLGRADTTVKVRGSWADPDRVTDLLRQHPEVANAAVVADESAHGRPVLRGWVVAAAAEPRPDLAARLRTYLAERVGPQSLPATLRLLPALPLLSSGKLDLRRLRALEPPGTGAGIGSSTTGADLADTVLAVFRDVLAAPAADPEQSFTDLGGDSLSAIVLCSRLQAATGRRVRVRDLHRHPCPAALTAHLRGGASAPSRTFELPELDLHRPRPPRGRNPRTVLLTGATGRLGGVLLRHLLDATDLQVLALVRAADDGAASERLAARTGSLPESRMIALAGDLARPGLGLAEDRFTLLAERVDAVVHVAANLDMFAPYEALAPANVAGTRELLRLAFAAGAAFHHLSSSSVLPLNEPGPWDEHAWGMELVQQLAPRLAHSDDYSRSKLAAETLIWQARDRGLTVQVTRVPHLTGEAGDSRLEQTLRALLGLGVLPEENGAWQLAPLSAVCRRMAGRIAKPQPTSPLQHVTTRPVSVNAVADALEARGRPMRRLPLAAFGHAVTEALGRWDDPALISPWRALDQLIREHGPRAALSLADAELGADEYLDEDPAELLIQSLYRS